MNSCMPMQLQKIQRRGPDEWKTTNLMSVSFASLVPLPLEEVVEELSLPTPEPPCLSERCRTEIRRRLRAAVLGKRPVRSRALVGAAQEEGSECGEGEPCQRRQAKRRRRLQRYAMPMLQVPFPSSD